MVSVGSDIAYTYDENGIRTSKEVGGITTYFNTSDGIILSQSDDENTLIFQYDNGGLPVGFTWNGTQYYYLTNSSGDVLGICDTSGEVLVEYTYDEWGKLIDLGISANADEDLAEINPLRYRGYYYDEETGFYYLQSRYYNPEICRFISEDSYTNTETGTSLQYNMFAYCENDPVNSDDPNGERLKICNNVKNILNALNKLTSDTLVNKNGKISIKNKKTNPKYYYGTVLLRKIINSKHRVDIVTDNSLYGSKYMPFSKGAYHLNNKKNMYLWNIGSGGTVYITKNSVSKDKNKNTLYIVLAHELIHAYRGLYGVMIPNSYTQTESKSVRINGNNVLLKNISFLEEMYTVGLYKSRNRQYFQILITENLIRNEHGLYRRSSYAFW